VVPLIIISASIDVILQWLGAKAMLREPWLLLGIAVWCVGNAVQHVYGSFILSYGKGFSFALKASTLGLVLSSITFLASILLGLTVAVSFVLTGCIYALTALFYRNFVKNLLKYSSNAPQSTVS
jgi:hypothetical protein